MALTLRPYQRTWLRRIHKAKGRVLVVGPTGAGKTVVATSLIRKARRSKKRVLFLAHRTELIHQCVARLAEAGIKSVGVIQADTPPDLDQPIQVASVQTLARRPELMAGYDVVIIDEAHHATSPTYRKILEANEGAKVYGLTATPRRLDGKPLNDLFDSVAQSEPVSKLIELGALNHPRVFSVSTDLADIKTRGGDYAREELSKVCNTTQLLGDAVAHWERFAEGRPTVVYAVDVAHATATAERFNAAGYRAKLITGETPNEERAAILRGLTTGEVQIVVNVEVLTEGWDCPDVSCAVILRPTQSETLAFQMAGRAMRRNSKWTHAIILDHAGNYVLHGLPSADRDYTNVLTEEQVSPRRHSDNIARAKACPECGSEVSFGSRACGFCEHAFWIGGPPAEVAGWLEEVTVSKRDRALQMMRNGVSGKATAKAVGVSDSCVWRWAKQESILLIDPRIATSDQRERALQMIRDGASGKAVAKAVGVSDSCVCRWAKQESLLMINKNFATSDQCERALQMIRDGASAPVAAKAIGVSSSTVRALLNQEGYTLSGRGPGATWHPPAEAAE